MAVPVHLASIGVDILLLGLGLPLVARAIWDCCWAWPRRDRLDRSSWAERRQLAAVTVPRPPAARRSRVA